MKPLWNSAPKWAKYLAMDGNEEWHWYELEPKWDEVLNEWMTPGRYDKAEYKVGNGTLEERSDD